jgi:integrase
MANVFKRKKRDGKPAKNYSIKYRDERGKWKLVAGFPDKEASRRLGAKLETEAGLRAAGLLAEFDLSQGLPFREFDQHLTGKGNGDKHVSLTVNRVKAICVDRFASLADLRTDSAADKLTAFLNTKSQASANHYLAAFKIFLNWLIVSGKIPDSPLSHVKRNRVTPEANRRAATPKEFERLIKATKTAPDWRELTGERRALLYTVARHTGFRANELCSLTPSSFSFYPGRDRLNGHVTLAARNAKNRQCVDQPLPPGLPETLQKALRGLPPHEPIWPGQWQLRAATMLRGDLKRAKVKYRLAGRVLDFHSLRVTFITELARAGVPPSIAQRLARHSDINLTMRSYTQLTAGEVAAALPPV